MKYVFVKCTYCNYPHFVNVNLRYTKCFACAKEFEIVDVKENDYYVVITNELTK